MARCRTVIFNPDDAPPCGDGLGKAGLDVAGEARRRSRQTGGHPDRTRTIVSKAVAAIVSVAYANAVIATAVQAQDRPPLPLEDRAQAVECLTLAVAYEAGFEPVEGQQAVAEVVLNRVRHPAFPKSVCDVVFAGSTRKTGCQFTFTCDGSMRRRLPDAVLARARAVAEQAIDGQLPPLIGDATNYHADYVSPYWAPTLVRVTKIGLHIFYKRPGVGGAGDPLVAPTARASAAASSEGSQAGPFAPWGLGPVTPTRPAP